MRRIEVGIAPIWEHMPGFGAAYSLRWATGLGITLFDSAEALAAANATAAAWGRRTSPNWPRS